MDDTQHITQDQYNEIILQLEELLEINAPNFDKMFLQSFCGDKSDVAKDKDESIKRCARTILDILCLDVADV